MGTEAPTSIVIPVHCAPKKAPCPQCGRRGRRKRILTRAVRTVAYKAIAHLKIIYGEYAARCGCLARAVRGDARSHHPGRSSGGAGRILNAGRATAEAVERPARTGLSYSEVLLKLAHRPCVVDTPWTESAAISPIRPAGPTAPTGSPCARGSIISLS